MTQSNNAVVPSPARSPEVRLLTYTDLCRWGIDYSYTSLWRMWKAGQFPAPIKLGAKRNAWRQSEIEDWLNSQPKAA